MATPSREVAHARSRIAGKRRQNPTADVTELRRDLRAAKAADYIRKLVDEAPPLTAEQRDKLAQLLRPVRRPDDGPEAA